jgi:murein DD-endopeptidase MepM/ murein hydrolase activator NlpD
MARDERRGYAVMVVPEGEGQSRTWKVSARRAGLLKVLAWTGGVLVLGVVGSWGFLLREALDARALRLKVADLTVQVGRVAELDRQLILLEGQHERLRGMLSAGTTAESPPQLWLPPAGGRATGPSGESAESALPSSWPLTERGFVTRSLIDGSVEDHTGLDVAVPAGSYIRAAGAGTILAVEEDPVYGRFVSIDHGNGYSTLYAHASEILLNVGVRVRQNEVIGLTGSTGRSTAPHLHFEIIQDGSPVDPLTLVTQP